MTGAGAALMTLDSVIPGPGGSLGPGGKQSQVKQEYNQLFQILIQRSPSDTISFLNSLLNYVSAN